MTEWAAGMRDFEDTASGPALRRRIQAAYEKDKAEYLDEMVASYRKIEERAQALGRAGEYERALTPEARQGTGWRRNG